MSRSIATLSLFALTLAPSVALADNGAPSGEHYTLNIIGKDRVHRSQISSGNRIFVPLYDTCEIWLEEGDDFDVLDGNATDDLEAGFQLPDPDPDNDGTTAWSVYARALGTPGGSATITSCYEDTDGTRWCSTEQVVLTRSSGGVTDFMDVTTELTSGCYDTDGDGACDDREFLFDDENHDYYWEYDNNGLRVAQLRFHKVATVVGLEP